MPLLQCSTKEILSTILFDIFPKSSKHFNHIPILSLLLKRGWKTSFYWDDFTMLFVTSLNRGRLFFFSRTGTPVDIMISPYIRLFQKNHKQYTTNLNMPIVVAIQNQQLKSPTVLVISFRLPFPIIWATSHSIREPSLSLFRIYMNLPPFDLEVHLFA